MTATQHIIENANEYTDRWCVCFSSNERGWYKNGPRNQIEEWSDSRNVIVEFVHTYRCVRMCAFVFVIFNDNNLLKFMGLSR